MAGQLKTLLTLTMLRKKKGWTQTELAVRAGMHQTELSVIERGHLVAPSPEKIARLAKALDAEPSDLLMPYEEYVLKQAQKISA